MALPRFGQASGASRRVLHVDEFLGVDYTSQSDSVSPKMSPCAPNMIRSVPGKVRKMTGWYVAARYEGPVRGSYARRGDSVPLVHAGTALYRDGTALYTEAADAPSRAFQFGEALYILDGKALLVYDGETVAPVAGPNAYIPTFCIAEDPAGGGEEYEKLNLLQPQWYELYQGKAGVTDYHLSFTGLDADFTPRAWCKNEEGEWVETTDFTVDRENGVLHFADPPGESPIQGEDNVKILASRTIEGYADRINHCTVGIAFGVNGEPDRLFVGGNPALDYLNCDWYSGQNDPTYFADTAYAAVGSRASAVMGYAIVAGQLATFKDARETDRNILMRRGDLVDSEPAFPVTGSLQGPGCCAPRSLAYLGSEPLFATKSGVCALTTSDISGERYSHTRSYYINAVLTKDPALAEACALVWDDMYWLFCGGRLWLLDDLQWQYPAYAGSGGTTMFANRQLSCFERQNVPAISAWTDDDGVCFGTADGRLCRFFTDPDSLISYSDGGYTDEAGVWHSGAPIAAFWETPDLSGQLFYKNKNFAALAVKLSPAAATGAALWQLRRGLWQKRAAIEDRTRYFAYSHLCYSRFTYSNDSTSRALRVKLALRKADKGRFRFANEALDEPFGLLAYAAEYTENGDYRG